MKKASLLIKNGFMTIFSTNILILGDVRRKARLRNKDATNMRAGIRRAPT